MVKKMEKYQNKELKKIKTSEENLKNPVEKSNEFEVNPYENSTGYSNPSKGSEEPKDQVIQGHSEDIKKIYAALNRLAVQLEELSKQRGSLEQQEYTSNAARLVDEIGQTNIPAVVGIAKDIIKKSDEIQDNLRSRSWSDNQIINEFKAYSEGTYSRMNQTISYLEGIQTLLFNLRNEINTIMNG